MLLLLLLLLLLADPSQVARYLLWRDVAAGASNTPLMSRAAKVPLTPLPDRHEPTALHPHLKEKKDTKAENATSNRGLLQSSVGSPTTTVRVEVK